MAELELKLGQTVETKEHRQGVTRYIGPLHIASGTWLGLELPDAAGKNDGSVKGERYFTCKPGYGIFVREESIDKIVRQPPNIVPPKPNGSTTAPSLSTKPRPSSGITADVARRRQSLMSNGSGSAAGSRLSTRSPTKLLSKPTSTSASSTTSTPRAGTPSTAANPISSSTRPRPSIGTRSSMGPPSGATRTSTNPSRPSIGAVSNLRSSNAPKTTAPPSRPTSISARLSQSARASPLQERRSPIASKEQALRGRSQQTQSPTISEEPEQDVEGDTMTDDGEKPQVTSEIVTDQNDSDDNPSLPHTSLSAQRPGPALKTEGVGVVESRTANQRELEQLKAKVRSLERQRQEDRDKLGDVEKLRSEKDRFENIIQALQRKIRANQQETADIRRKCNEAEARAAAIPDRSGEQESELELATLDKEMAEERAEIFEMELQELKAKHETMVLENDVLKGELEELSSTMTPDERANAGRLHMQNEIDRLRLALEKLRDLKQDMESELKDEIDELREDLDEASKTASLYATTSGKLARAEETNKHLIDQLEAVESSDEVVEAMQAQREKDLRTIEQMRMQLQEFEEHIQVADELDVFHVDEEKRLYGQLDEREALLSEGHRRILEQDRLIEELEYHLTKFREMVHGLQSDIDELRRSREISEQQATDLSSKSREIMDQNRTLQSNAAKTQTKWIDTELNEVKAQLATKHVEILSLFTPAAFEVDKRPILTFLCFGRIKLKAKLVGNILIERLRARPHLSNDEEIFRTFETIEHMQYISETCHQFERYLESCKPEGFAACGGALAELEPVEQTVSSWIEALRIDELSTGDPERLKRMQNILVDLAEKFIPDNIEARASELIACMSIAESYSESLAGQFVAMRQMIQARLGPPTGEDENSLIIHKRVEQMATKTRTIKYIFGKLGQQLSDLRSNSLCPAESSWMLFEEAKQEAGLLSRQVRTIGLTLAAVLSELEIEGSTVFASLASRMVSALQQSTQNNINSDDDPFDHLSRRLNALQSLVDGLQVKSSDLSNTHDFEPLPAPWTVLAHEIQTTKTVPPDVQNELSRLERRNAELGSKIVEREKTIEEMSMRVEIAEKRFKESREKDNKEKALQQDLDHLRSEKATTDQTISDLRAQLQTAASNIESSKTELEALREATNKDVLSKADTASSTANGSITSGLPVDSTLLEQFEVESRLLNAGITSLQATVRNLREENRALRIPISEVLINSAKTNWLDPSIMHSTTAKKPTSAKKESLERSGQDLYTQLITLAKSAKPIRLSPTSPTTHAHDQKQPSTFTPSASTWQPISTTPRYAVLQQREQLETWESYRTEFIARAKIQISGTRGLKPSDPKQRKNKSKNANTNTKIYPSTKDNPTTVDVRNFTAIEENPTKKGYVRVEGVRILES